MYVGFIFGPIFHLKLKPPNLCGQAAVVPHLLAPCLPSGDKMRQADLYVKPRNTIFVVHSLSMNFQKKVEGRYVSGRVKAMITQAVVRTHKDQVEQVRRPCVCVVRCMYNTRLSLATVSLLLLYCSSLEEVLFVKSFKSSSPYCVARSCLCSQDFPSDLLYLTFGHFSGLNSTHPPPPPQAFSAQTGLFSSIFIY